MNKDSMINYLKEFKLELAEKNNKCSDKYFKDEYQSKYIATAKMIKILEEEK